MPQWRQWRWTGDSVTQCHTEAPTKTNTEVTTLPSPCTHFYTTIENLLV